MFAIVELPALCTFKNAKCVISWHFLCVFNFNIEDSSSIKDVALTARVVEVDVAVLDTGDFDDDAMNMCDSRVLLLVNRCSYGIKRMMMMVMVIIAVIADILQER
jgi:hypothetical protein